MHTHMRVSPEGVHACARRNPLKVDEVPASSHSVAWDGNALVSLQLTIARASHTQRAGVAVVHGSAENVSVFPNSRHSSVVETVKGACAVLLERHAGVGESP